MFSKVRIDMRKLFVPYYIRSKFGAESEKKKFHTIRMEASKTTVPSIVVYVTVPNKEAGLLLVSYFMILPSIYKTLMRVLDRYVSLYALYTCLASIFHRSC